MRRRNKIDVMSALVLKAQHLASKFIRGQSPGVSKILADLVILAVHTAQVASGKKDGSRTSYPGDRRFLPKMETDMGNLHPGRDFAKTDLSIQPVHSAFAWTAFAVCQLIY